MTNLSSPEGDYVLNQEILDRCSYKVQELIKNPNKRYSLQYGNKILLAPSPQTILGVKAVPNTAINTPNKMPAKIISVKSCAALFCSPAPILRATIALPPVASIVPRPTIKLITGQTIFNAESAFISANRATKIVSTTVYSPINIIIKIVGNANFSNDFIVKFCDSGFISFIFSVLRLFFLQYRTMETVIWFLQYLPALQRRFYPAILHPLNLQDFHSRHILTAMDKIVFPPCTGQGIFCTWL